MSGLINEFLAQCCAVCGRPLFEIKDPSVRFRGKTVVTVASIRAVDHPNCTGPCPLDPTQLAGHCECWSALGDPCCFCGSTEDDDIPYSCSPPPPKEQPCDAPPISS